MILKRLKTAIGGKQVTISARQTKSGKIQYLRAGKVVTSQYQKRLVKGLLEGKTIKEATGKSKSDFNKKWKKFVYTNNDILKEPEAGKGGSYSLENWATSPNRSRNNPFERHAYYAKVMVTSESMAAVGSEPKAFATDNPKGDVCTPVTLRLRANVDGDLVGITYGEFQTHFESLILQAVARSKMKLCTGSLDQDLIGTWRHK